MESSQVRALSQRIPMWDNAKGILIFLVVTGHFLMYIQGNINAQRMLIMIYLFHMPAFIFISGLMSQRAISEHNHKKALYFLEIFLVIKAWMIIVRLISGNFDAGILNLMEMDDVSWYAFSLAVFYIVAMAFSECNKRAVIMISVAVACLVGYCDSIGTFFSLSRIFVFFPVFYMGFRIHGQFIQSVNTDMRLKVIALAIFTTCAIVIFLNIHSLWRLLGLLQGKYPYGMILGSDEQAGAVYRMGWYFLIILLIPAFLSLIPERTLPIVSRAGRNSLSIYVLHNPLIFMIMHSGLKKIVIYNGVSLMMCSLLLTAALSFIPLNNVQNMQKAKTML